MDWKKRVSEGLSQGLDSSRKILEKARDRAKELGDHGVLTVEIRELENQLKIYKESLGTTVYDLFAKENRASVTAKNNEIKELLAEIANTEVKLQEKKAEQESIQEKTP